MDALIHKGINELKVKSIQLVVPKFDPSLEQSLAWLYLPPS